MKRRAYLSKSFRGFIAKTISWWFVLDLNKSSLFWTLFHYFPQFQTSHGVITQAVYVEQLYLPRLSNWNDCCCFVSTDFTAKRRAQRKGNLLLSKMVAWIAELQLWNGVFSVSFCEMVIRGVLFHLLCLDSSYFHQLVLEKYNFVNLGTSL